VSALRSSERETLHGWLMAIYELMTVDEQVTRKLGEEAKARHCRKQMKAISNILARMTAAEHPIIR